MAKFENFKDRETVKSAAEYLDKKYSIREHYPTEIENRRKVLYPELKRAKSILNKNARIVRDKLIVNGRVFTHKDFTRQDSSKPDHTRALARSSKEPTSDMGMGSTRETLVGRRGTEHCVGGLKMKKLNFTSIRGLAFLR